jgi:hypothetical protein
MRETEIVHHGCRCAVRDGHTCGADTHAGALVHFCSPGCALRFLAPRAR